MAKRKATSDPQHDEVDSPRPKKKQSLAERKREAQQKALAAMARLEASSKSTSIAVPAKKRGRKSESDAESQSSSSSSRRIRRRGRSSAAAAAFRFEPIRETAREEDDNNKSTPLKPSEEYRTTSIAETASPHLFTARDERTPERKASDRKRQREKLARAKRYRDSLDGTKRKGGNTDDDDDEMEPASSQLNSLPATAATTAATPVTAAKATATTASKPQPNEPPSSLSNIFYSPKKKQQYNRPPENFDPSRPFPPRGYRPPVAAYCGCGPTPAVPKNDLCDFVVRSNGIGGEGDTADDSFKMDEIRVEPGYPARARMDPEETRPTDHTGDEKAKDSIAEARAAVSLGNTKRRAELGLKDNYNDDDTKVAVQMLRVSGKEPEETTNQKANVDQIEMEETVMEPVDEKEVDTPSFTERMTKRVLSILFLAMMAQLAYGVYHIATYHAFPVVTRSNVTTTDAVRSRKPETKERPQCFIDHPADHYAPDEEMDEQRCAGNYVPCPQWGRCHAGVLRDCDDAGNYYRGIKRFEPDGERTSCVPTRSVRHFVHMVQEVLRRMTAVQSCHVWDKLGKGDVVPSTSERVYPMFRMEKVVESMESLATDGRVNDTEFYSLDLLLWLEPVDSSLLRYGSLSAEEGVVDAVGLSNDVSPDSLKLPLSCTARIISWELFVMTFGGLWYLAKCAWHCIRWHPFASAVTVFVSFIVVMFIKRKARKAKIDVAYPQMKDAAYDRLAETDDDEGYPVLMLRDDIVHEMYPTNLKARAFLYNDVWPRVVAEVHADNRVRKFRKEANGKNLEHWDLHKKPKGTRRLRKSLGGSAPKLDEVAKEEIPPVGRDP